MNRLSTIAFGGRCDLVGWVVEVVHYLVKLCVVEAHHVRYCYKESCHSKAMCCVMANYFYGLKFMLTD